MTASCPLQQSQVRGNIQPDHTTHHRATIWGETGSMLADPVMGSAGVRCVYGRSAEPPRSRGDHAGIPGGHPQHHPHRRPGERMHSAHRCQCEPRSLVCPHNSKPASPSITVSGSRAKHAHFPVWCMKNSQSLLTLNLQTCEVAHIQLYGHPEAPACLSRQQRLLLNFCSLLIGALKGRGSARDPPCNG